MPKVNLNKKTRKKRRVSARINGTEKRPRISVFRSNRFIYAQAINDEKRTTVAAFSSLTLGKDKAHVKTKKNDEAKLVGQSLAKALKEKKVNEAVFDRNIYIYKGRIKNLAEGLREGGIKI